MGDKADRALGELSAGYQALGDAILSELRGSDVSYEVGYLDGWADAMYQASMAAEGEPVKPGKAFPLFVAKRFRRLARRGLKEKREKRL